MNGENRSAGAEPGGDWDAAQTTPAYRRPRCNPGQMLESFTQSLVQPFTMGD